MTTFLCSICNGELEPPNVATCHFCQQDFHLEVLNDTNGKDCGRVWLHEFRMHLVFACSACLESGIVELDPFSSQDEEN